MAKNKTKDVFMQKPIERHITSPLQNIYKTKPISNVIMPSEMEIMNAKEYVDANQK